MSLANDNFIGFGPHIIQKYNVKWIELAVASPVFTCMVVYYIEADRGHLLHEVIGEAQHGTVVRGNAYSFHMPWDTVYNQLNEAIEDRSCSTLPHFETTIAQMVQYNLRVGDIIEINEFVPQARLRPFVVLNFVRKSM